MNEKGFMFPVTLCVLLLFSLFLSLHFNLYLSEKRSSIEIEHFERNQFYFLQALKKVEQLLLEEGYPLTDIFFYEKGTVTYSVSELEPELLQITYRLNTEVHTDLLAMSYYDTALQRTIKWVERN